MIIWDKDFSGFGYAKLCLELDVLRVKMKMKFNWDNSVAVGVKGLSKDR